MTLVTLRLVWPDGRLKVSCITFHHGGFRLSHQVTKQSRGGRTDFRQSESSQQPFGQWSTSPHLSSEKTLKRFLVRNLTSFYNWLNSFFSILVTQELGKLVFQASRTIGQQQWNKEDHKIAQNTHKNWEIKTTAKIGRTGRSKQRNNILDIIHQYFKISLLGSGNWNDESYKSWTTSMLRKRERNTNQDCKSSLLSATWKIDFLSRTRNKHAMEARTAIRDKVTSIKRQLEKQISSVVQETSRHRSRERNMRSPVTPTQQQLKRSVVQVVHMGIKINLNIHTTNTNNNTWKLSPATGKTSRDNRQGRVSKQTRDFPRAQKYLGELWPIRQRLR